MEFNVADLVEAATDAVPERDALVAGEVRHTFASLDQRANRAAHHLAENGVEAGNHVGIYAYRVGFLKRYVAAPATEIERAERLEQLRALHMGGQIHVATVSEPPGPGVDTADDLARVRAIFGSGSNS